MALASQQRIGSYRLLNIVKTGQTSQVWAVMNDATQARMALKVLLQEFRKNREHIGFLKQEYLVGKDLHHKRVIDIQDYGVDAGVPYLAMEYFPYPNMKDIINQVWEIVGHLMPKIIEGAAEGVAYLNEQGWIHRDIKPDNFLVNDQGDVKLIDFALAQRKANTLQRLLRTRTKTIQGTRSYMSPEQIRGQPLTPASDVYSFACTIFHLLARQPPFTGGTSNELLNKHLKSAAPSVQAYNRNVTAEFGELLRQMMVKRPDQRIRTMGQFLKDFKVIRVFKEDPRPPVHSDDETSEGE